MLDIDLYNRPLEFPRNLWTRLRVALHLLQKHEFYQARKLIEGARYHPEMSEAVYEVFNQQLEAAETQFGAVRRINIPADFSGSHNPRLLKPFRRLAPDQHFPNPYPWSMPLPGYVGAHNDTTFLTEAAAALSGTFVSARKRILVCYSPLDASPKEVAETLGTLSKSAHDGRIDVHVFGSTQQLPALTLVGRGTVSRHDEPILSDAGLDILRNKVFYSDLVLFLSGAAQFDKMALRRAVNIAEVTDTVIQPLVTAKSTEDFTTIFTQSHILKSFTRRYPFRAVNGLNFLVSPELLRETGLLDARFGSTLFAGRELSYRAHAKGAYFLPLALPKLRRFEDPREVPADEALYTQTCPNHWDRKTDARFEVAKVSVYIPAYNAAKYIERAVDSVLEQDVADLDVCIANDGSRDNTMDLLHSRYGNEPRVKVLNNPNGGISFASNSAIRMSNSQYIGQLDSDDCLKPGAVRRLMEHLDENPAIVCAYGSCERIDAAGNYDKDEYSWPVFTREKMMITSIAHHFRMFRRYAWERTTHFREDIVNGVDYDIFLKMSEVGAFHHVDEKLYQRRWHGENTSNVNEHHQTTNTYRVQREALKRLGMDRHWDIHVPDPAQPRLVSYKRKPNIKVLVFWPDYSRANPYQKLLYQSLNQETEVVSGTIEAAQKLIETKSADAKDITFHLHWLNAILRDCKTPVAAKAAADDFLSKIKNFIWKGGRFVWTIHNTVSHDTPFDDIEIELSARLAEVAHALHFHSAASVEEVAQVFAIPADKVVISRHGNYIGVYPDYVTRAAAREVLGLGPEDDVIVFTGQIRSYKGINTLIAAFSRILVDRPQARLVLAGKADGDPLAGQIPALTDTARARIHTVGRFIENGELQLFLRAADIAAYPYQKILTSGSLLLALSFGLPIVIPRVGMTAELLEGRDAGMLYDGDGGSDSLEVALRDLLAAKDSGHLDRFATSARDLAEQQTWPCFSQVLSEA